MRTDIYLLSSISNELSVSEGVSRRSKFVGARNLDRHYQCRWSVYLEVIGEDINPVRESCNAHRVKQAHERAKKPFCIPIRLVSLFWRQLSGK